MDGKITAACRLDEITGAPGVPGPGRTFVCSVCGTRVREGQPHRTDVRPAHSSLAALIREERLDPDADWGRPFVLNLSRATLARGILVEYERTL